VFEITTLVCVATDARLTKVEAAQVARSAQAGMARAVAPVHTRLDGDVAFCLATGARPGTAFACGAAAADATAAAIRDAVVRATALAGVPSGAERQAGERPA
jgi:L-aminopeptidase/D-esterase-like protein